MAPAPGRLSVFSTIRWPLCATAGAFVIHVVTDIFRGSHYTEIWLLSLYAMAVAIGLAFRTAAFPLTLILLSDMGAEDLFFFIFKRRLPPPRLPALDSHALIPLKPVTPVSLVVGTVLAVAIGAALVFAELWLKGRLRARRPKDPGRESAAEGGDRSPPS